jgi:hypothetical protein
MRDICGLTGKERRAQVIPEVGFGGYRVDIVLPALRKLAGYVKWCRAWSHAGIK